MFDHITITTPEGQSERYYSEAHLHAAIDAAVANAHQTWCDNHGITTAPAAPAPAEEAPKVAEDSSTTSPESSDVEPANQVAPAPATDNPQPAPEAPAAPAEEAPF